MSAIAVQQEVNWEVMEKVVVGGDLSKLSAEQRLTYYRQLCESLRLNPLTRPFQYITLQGKLTLYATKDATEQIRKKHHISIERVEKEIINDTYVVTVYGRDEDGRTDTEMGAVSIKGKSGDDLVNAMLKALTKAKRRLTLSMCGLGILDETEIDTIRDARRADVDADGQVIAPPAPIRAISAPPPAPERQLASSQQQRLLWKLCCQYYGDEAEAKIHEIIEFQYPLARKADKPSITALSVEEAGTIIDELRDAAEQPTEQE